MLNHPYLKLLSFALIIPFFIPIMSKVLVYIHMINAITDNSVDYCMNYLGQSLGLDQPIILTQVLSLMFWPVIISLFIDLFYRFVLKKTFQQYIICAILLWLFFNCGRFLVQ
jgi:hypothetical protein